MENRKGYDNDLDTVFAFSIEKKTQIATEESPRRRGKSSAFAVPDFSPHMMEAAKQELRGDDTIVALLNLIVCGLSFMQHALFFSNNYVSTDFITSIRILILGLSLSSILWVWRRYHVKLIMLLIRYKISAKDSVFSTGLYKPLILEILLALVIIPPYVDNTLEVKELGFTIVYSYSGVLSFFSLVRLYVILRLFGHYSEYTHEKAQAICSKHAVVADTFFAIKCYIQETPFVGIGGSFIIMAAISGLALELSEQPSTVPFGTSSANTSHLVDYWDDLWTVLYTTTTIGYGNLYPITHTGRAVCILACILGNMYLGMLVVSMTQKLNLDEGQNLAYAWISRGYIKEKIKIAAKKAVRTAMTMFLLNRRWGGKTICPLKPHGIVNCRGVVVHNDLCCLSKEQYLTKVRLFRQLKSQLEEVSDLNQQARDVGSSETDIIYQFEDVIRIEFPKIIRKIKGKIEDKSVKAAADMGKVCRPLEEKADSIRDFSKTLRRKVAHLYRRRTIAPQAPGGARTSARSLTNIN
jgi:hypothetical protein